MKIVISSNSSWNLMNFRAGLIKALLKEGHQVICIIPQGEASQSLKELGVDVQEVFINATGTSVIGEMRYFYHLFYTLFKTKPDYYLGYTIKPNIYGALISRILKIKSIINITGLGSSFLKNNFLTKIIFSLYRVSLSSAHLIFFQNEEDQEIFYHTRILTTQKTMILPGSGVNLNKFSMDFVPNVLEETVKKNKSKVDFNFLLISRLLVDKGILEFIEAIKILKTEDRKFTAIILGPIEGLNSSSIDRAQLKNWVSQDLVIHHDFTDDVRPYIYNADCVVLPSYREGTPKSLLEAGAMGKPLIATNVPGCRNVIEDGLNGFLCEPKSSQGLAVAMRKVLTMNSEMLKNLGIESQKKITKEYDETIIHQIYLNLIK